MAIKDSQFVSGAIDGWNSLEGESRGGFQGRKSIIGQARQNIFEFPVFVVNTLPLDFATATVSLLEQVYASFLQMAVAAKPMVSADQIRKGRQFSHLKTDTNRYLEYTEDMPYVHDACYNKIITESGMVYEYEMISYDNEIGRIFNEYLEHEPLSEFSHFIQEASAEAIDKELMTLLKKKDKDHDEEKRQEELINLRDIVDKNISRQSNRQRDELALATDARAASKNEREEREDSREERAEQRAVNKDRRDSIYAASKELRDANADARAENKETRETNTDLETRYPRIAISNEEKKIESLINQMNALASNDPKRNDLESDIKTALGKIDQLKVNTATEDNKNEAILSKERRDRMVKASEILKDQDIQKLNTMKPFMMVVRLRRDSETDSEPFEFVIGVKCRLRMVSADMMPEVAEYPLREMNKISRKVKWKAGELKFFKDILFKIPQRKQTAIDSRDPKRKWFRRLHELAHAKGDSASANFMTSQKLSMNSLFDMSNFDGGVIPNASIIITKSVVDNVKSKTGIDLLRSSEAMEFCKELFLISFIVIDQDAESIKVLLPDLHGDFEVHSLASVNKQLASLDTAGVKTREVFKVLS